MCRALMLTMAAGCLAGATLGCGSGVAASVGGALTISPVSLNFGDVGVGQLVNSSIALSNTASAPITISQIGVAGQMFALTSADQLPVSIPPGGRYTVKVKFAPAAENDFSGELTVLNSSATPLAQLQMYGRGTRRGHLVASPGALSFGTIPTGSVDSQTLNLSWTGSYPTTIKSITAGGPGFSTPALSLPLTVYPGQPVALKVQFAPTAKGSATGKIAIGWGKRDDSTLIALNGSGIAPADAELSLSATALTFMNTPVNSATTQTLTLMSTGTSPVTVAATTITGAGFTLGGAPFPLTLTPGQPATLQVRFAPTTTGTIHGQLLLHSNSNTGPSTLITLSGTGTTAPRKQLTVSATELSFGSVTVNSATTQALTLTSTGTVPATVSSATVNGRGFSLSAESLPITLAPMQSTTLQVKFAAASTGMWDGQLTMNSDSTTGGTTEVGLEGIGDPELYPQLTVSAAALSFGDVTVDSATTQALTLTSTGTSPVTVNAATITGGRFTIVGGSLPAILAPRQSTTLQVQFAPKTAGLMEGELVLTSNSSRGGTTPISLSGTSTEAPNPQLSLSAAKLSFGTVTVNSPTTQALTLTSTGTSPVTVSAATVTGAGFTISGGTLPINLNPMESTTLQVQFDPMAMGALDGQLTIRSDSRSGSTSSVSLEGAGAAAPVPQLTVSAGALSFGQVTVNSSTTQAVTLTSTGTAAVTLSAETITGAGFSLVNADTPVTLAAGQSITLEVRFAPATTGLLTGQLTLRSDSSGGATTLVLLSGTTTAAPKPQLTLGAMTLTFDAEPVGTATTQTLTLVSSGTAAVTIQSASITGAGFGITGGSFPATLSPGQSVVVHVTFVPTEVESSTGQLTINSNSSSGATAIVALSGSGKAIAVPQLSVSTSALSFGNTAVGKAVTQAITLSSSGTLAVTVNSVAIAGSDFSVVGGSSPVTLAPGQSATVSVQYKPASAGSDTGQVTITSNSTTGNSEIVALSGAGLALAHEIDLSWDAPTTSPEPVAGYNVYRALGSGTFQLVNSTPLPSTAYVDTALASGSTYNYVVKSVDAAAVESSASNGITVSVP